MAKPAAAGAATETTAALERLNAVLKQLEHTSAVEKLTKKLEKARDPLKRQALDTKLQIAQTKFWATEADKVAKSQDKAGKATGGFLAKFKVANPGAWDKLGGVIEERFGKKVARSFEKVAAGEGKFVDKLRVAGAGASLLGDLAGKAAMGVLALGSAALDGGIWLAKAGIAAKVFGDEARTQIGFLVGNTKAAGYFEDIAQMAIATGQPIEALTAKTKAMLDVGLDIREAQPFALLATDLEKATGKDVSPALARIAESLKKNQAVDIGSVFADLGIAGDAKTKGLYAIANKLGVAGDSQIQTQRNVQQALAGMTAQKRADMTQLGLLSSLGEEIPGDFAKKVSTSTLGGAFDRITNRWHAMLALTETGDASSPMIALLVRIGDLFDPATEGGAKFQKQLNAVASAATDVLTKVSRFDFERAFGDAMDIVNSVTSSLKSMGMVAMSFGAGFGSTLGPATTALKAIFGAFSGGGATDMTKVAAVFGTIGRALGVFVQLGAVVVGVALTFALAPLAIVAALGTVLVAFGSWALDLSSRFTAWKADIAGRALTAGADLARGFADGIANGATWVLDAIKGLGSSAMSAFRTLLKIGSPSKVFEGYGRWTGEGYARGIDGQQGRVEDALGGLLEGARPTGKGGAGGALVGLAGGGAKTFAPSIAITLEGVPTSDREAVGAIVDQAMRELTSRLEGMALEWGAV